MSCFDPSTSAAYSLLAIGTTAPQYAAVASMNWQTIGWARSTWPTLRQSFALCCDRTANPLPGSPGLSRSWRCRSPASFFISCLARRGSADPADPGQRDQRAPSATAWQLPMQERRSEPRTLVAVCPRRDHQLSRSHCRQQRPSRAGQQRGHRRDGRRHRLSARDHPRLLLHLARRQQRAEAEGGIHARRRQRCACARARQLARLAAADPLETLARHARSGMRCQDRITGRQSFVDL